MKNKIEVQKINAYDGIEIKNATFCQKQFPTHFHDSYALAMINYGTELLTFEDKQITISTQQLIIINPNELHSHANFDSEAWSYKALYLSKDVMQFFLKRFHFKTQVPLHFPHQVIENPFLVNIFQNIDNQSNIDLLIGKLLLHLLPIGMEKANKREPSNLEWCNEVKAFLSQYKCDKLSLENLAAHFKINKFTLLRQFKKATGITPNNYLLLERITYAKKLLESSGYSLTEIAHQSGFYDQSHFIHTFKRQVGVAPNDYRNALIFI